MKAYAGMEYGKFNETVLRDVPYKVYLQYKDRLLETWARRAEHWYGEYFRVQKAGDVVILKYTDNFLLKVENHQFTSMKLDRQN